MAIIDIYNYITSQHRELYKYGNIEFANLYTIITNEKLKSIFITLHGNFINLFNTMNERLPTNEYTAHFWAVSYNEEKNEYIMECLSTLNEYIIKNNTSLLIAQRKQICFQVLKAFKYIHSKGYLHRDISPNNVLVRMYDDVVVIKVSDFGLVKIPQLELTSLSSDIKGSFNDSSSSSLCELSSNGA